MSNQGTAPLWRRSIRFKVNLAISGVFLLVVGVLTAYTYVEERDKNLADAISHLSGMNAFYFDSLNTLMLADAMEEREALREKMLELPGITEVRVNRAPAVSDRFGPGLPSQQERDALDERALAGESVVEVRVRDGAREVTVIEPYALTKDTRGTNCLECHRRIEAGTVSGSVRLSYSLAEADAALVVSLARRFAVLLGLFALGVFALSTLMQRLVRVPVGQALAFADAVAGGDLERPIESRSDDELGQLIRALQTMQGNLRESIERDRVVAAEGLRIKRALDSSSTPTLVTDVKDRVIYQNAAALELVESLRGHWPGLPEGNGAVGLAGHGLGELLPAGALRDGYAAVDQGAVRLDGPVGARHISLHVGPVFDEAGECQGRVVQWEDLTERLAQEAEAQERLIEERRVAAENKRIRVALDQVSSNVMLADPERRVIYVNRATRAMLRDAVDDFRAVHPGFDADGVMGQPLDALVGGAAGKGLPATLNERHESELDIGRRTLRLVANPVVDDDGTRLGTALEWTDRTQEVAIEQEIDQLVDAARGGELTRRIALSGKRGFFRQLGEGFNSLMDELSSVFDDIARVMGGLADGDLGQNIERDYQGRFGQVKTDVNRTLVNLEDIVGRLDAVSGQVRSAADEISSGNGNLSARTEKQAASLQETAASMQEITTTVRNSADNAQQANQVAAGARQAAEHGGEVVGRAVDAMQQISTASSRIAEITGVIDEIAFQTNLLALNASVEAARAGEQGRGFAVVATEVRKLASRSAAAAKEIKELIVDSGAKVQVGAELVNETGESLDAIVQGVKKVGDIIAEMAAAAAEQSAGIDQVNRAITQIDEMTQQNAALAEQTAAASSAMSENARELQGVIGFFRRDGRSG
jgi:methyl-accepting chemotaxis protein